MQCWFLFACGVFLLSEFSLFIYFSLHYDNINLIMRPWGLIEPLKNVYSVHHGSVLSPKSAFIKFFSEHKRKSKSDFAFCKNKAFTLMELLVVIAVIAVLCTLLFPALMVAKNMAKRVACIGNMKNHAAAFGFYQSDYNDSFPVAGYDTSIGQIRNGWISKGRFATWTLNHGFHPTSYIYAQTQPQTKFAWYYFDGDGKTFRCPAAKKNEDMELSSGTGLYYRIVARDFYNRLTQCNSPDGERPSFRFNQISRLNSNLILYSCINYSIGGRGCYFVSGDFNFSLNMAHEGKAFISLFQDLSVRTLNPKEMNGKRYFDWTGFKFTY